MATTPLQKARQSFMPRLPLIFRDLMVAEYKEEPMPQPADWGIKERFPHTFGQPLLRAVKGSDRRSAPLRIGVVFSGGPAAGGHNVIAGLFDALKQLNPHSQLFGFLGGPAGIIQGNAIEITDNLLFSYRNQGGFDLIGSGRTKIETNEQLDASLKTAEKMLLGGIVVIGGDDSNTNAAVLAEYFASCGSAVKVIGVPKTIDGDLQNEYVAISFGFDTACKLYAEIIGNIARDAASSRKYTHFIKLMGRSASHIALECALATQPNMVFIGEEVKAKKRSLAQITAEIADLVIKRAELGKNYGVILVPEGLIEFIPEISSLIVELNQILAANPSLEIDAISSKLTPSAQSCFSSLPKSIQNQLLLHRDPHGNVQVSMIATEQLLMESVSEELERRKKRGECDVKYAFLNHFLGYEGRAGYPSNFDCNYCYALGCSAALLLDHGRSGYMCFVEGLVNPPEEWSAGGVPITALMHVEVRKGKEQFVVKKALVDLKGKPFIHIERLRKGWELEDQYLFPGPMQFYGDPSLVDLPPISIRVQ